MINHKLYAIGIITANLAETATKIQLFLHISKKNSIFAAIF